MRQHCVIRLAKKEEANTVFKLILSAKSSLEQKGIYQWNDKYPSLALIQKDIEQQYLYVYTEGDVILASINISTVQEKQYASIDWSFHPKKILVLHRLVVAPHFQGKGYARQLMAFAESYGRKHQYGAIRLDTYTKNERAISFYTKGGYSISGTIRFPGRTHPFYGMEKKIKHNMGKLLIFTAPSGAGKTTIVKHLLKTFDELAFSVSATSREQRYNETDGKDYYFLDPKEFKSKVEAGDFLEWEEVYDNQYYGTLKSEIERLWALGKTIVFDIDVKGAMNIKKHYPAESLAIFVNPPSKEILMQRLKDRKTEDDASFNKRIKRVTLELEYVNKFDEVLLNDILEITLEQAESIVKNYLELP